MKTIKRTVAALLAALMLSTSVNVLAAETYTDAEAVVVAKVNAAGVMQGTDKGFEPSKTLTRAEAAAIVVRMKGISESATKAMAGTTLFNDVAASHWASGYINQASNLGIVKGVSAKEFAPEREVTVAEFVTMAVRALGAGQLVDSEGTWPTNYVNFANDNDILKDVTAIYTATATRMNAATIVANTLEAPVWEKSGVKSNGEITWEKSQEVISRGTITPAKTILNSVLNIAKYENAILEDIDTKDRTVAIDSSDIGALASKDVASNVEMGSLKESKVYDVWYNTNSKEIVGIWKAEDSKTNEVEFTEIVKDLSGDKIKLMVNGAEKEYTFSADIDKETAGAQKALVSYNNGTADEYDAAAFTSILKENKNIFGTIILNGSKIEKMYCEQYTNYGVVKEVKSNRVKFETTDVKGENCTTLNIDKDDYEYVATKDGKDFDMADLEAGDVIFYYEDLYSVSDSKYVVKVMTDEVEGKVTAVSNNYIKLDGKRVDFAGSLTKSDFTPNDEITAWKNEAGYIVMFEVAEKANENYAVIKKLEAIEDNKGVVTAEITLVDLDGKTLDTMEIDLGKSANEVLGSDTSANKNAIMTLLFKDYAVSTHDTVTALNGDAKAKRALGELVAYEIKGGKVVITEFEDTDADEDITKVIDDIKVGKKNVTFGSYYITNDTKILLVKADGTSNKKVRVETVDFDSLDDSVTAGSAHVTAYVGCYDKDTKEVEILVVDEANFKRTSTQKFAVVLAVEDVDLDDNDDLDMAVDVVFQGENEIKTYYFDSTDVTELKPTTSPAYSPVYSVFELTIAGDEIIDVTETVKTTKANEDLSEVLAGPAFISEFFSNDTVEFVTAVTATPLSITPAATPSTSYDVATVDSTRYTLADDIIYVRTYKDGTYKLVNNITELDVDTENLYSNATAHADYKIARNASDASNILSMVIYTDDNGNDEIVAIVYTNEDLPVAP